jgi:putative nucleotidyltransferase with HDIG domain
MSRTARHLHRTPLRPAVLAAACLFVPGTVLLALGDRSLHERYELHFFMVALTTIIAAIAAYALTAVGVRRNDRRAVVVGIAFSAMAALLLVHALAPPGADLPDRDNGLIAYAGAAALPVGAVLLCLVGHPMLREPGAVRRLLALQAGLVAAILALGAAGRVFPGLVPGEPASRSPEAIAVLIGAGALFLRLAMRARRTWLLTWRWADLWVMIGIGWMTIALAASTLASSWSIDWWLGQDLQLLGLVAVGLPVALDLRRHVPSSPLAGDLGAAELVAHEEALLGPHVRALMLRLAAKDDFTEQHARRVALLAVRVGEQLGLPPGRLRRLALGGLLHDIGKLRVPEAILRKPASLDSDERDVISLHPDWGDQLAGELGFDASTRRLIRSHHERLDGAGYPDGLSGGQLDADIRILTVCDVFDALVSERVYRPAFTVDEAMAIMWDDAGRGFDPGCLRALAAVVGVAVEPPALRLAA